MKVKFIINFVYYFLIFVFTYIFLKYVLSLIFPVLLGFAIFVILQPITLFIHAKMKVSYKKSAFIMILIFYILSFLAIAWILSSLIIDIKGLSISFSQAEIDKFLIKFEIFKRNMLNNLQNTYFLNIIITLINILSSHTTSIISQCSIFLAKLLSDIIVLLPNIIINILLTFLSSIFMACEYQNIIKVLNYEKFSKIIMVKDAIKNTLLMLFKAYSLILFITFLQLVIGFYFTGVTHCIKVAFIISIFDILPAVGIGLFIIPWSICEFILGNSITALNLMVIYIVCIIIRNIVEPKILSSRIGVSPILTIICMIFGAKIFGFIGVFLAPVLLICMKKLIYLKFTEK